MIEKFKDHQRLWELPIVFFVTIALANVIETFIWVSCFTIALVESKRITKVPVIIQKLLHIVMLNNIVGNLGKWSYSTYLIHSAIFSVVVGSYAFLYGTAVQLKDLIGLMMLCIPIIIFVSWVLYSSVEVGGIALGKRVINRIKHLHPQQSSLPVSTP